jgi:putative ABC transport system permease protein
LYYAGGALVGPGELAILQQVFTTQQLGLIWNVGLDLTGLKAGQVPAAEAALRAEVAAGPTGVSSRFPSALTASTTGDAPLALFTSEQAAANQVLSLIIFGLFLIGLVLTLLAGRLLVLRRGGELATLRARGGTLGAVARQVLSDTAPLLVLALAVGTGTAVAISPGQGSALSWELAAVLAVAGLAGPPLLALSWCRDSATRRRLARGDAGAAAAPPGAGRRRGAADRRGRVRPCGSAAAAGGGGLDLLTGLGPQLVALLAALLVLRIYPVPLRLLLRLAARRRGAAVYLGLARAARAAPAALLPALALILAMALAGFGGMVLSSVTAARAAAAWRQTGADAVLTGGDLHPIPAAASRQLAAASGVRHAVTVSTESSEVADGGRTVNTTAVSAPLAAYAAVSSAAPFGSFAPSVLSQDHGGAIPVLVSPDLARLSGHISVLTTGVDRPLRIGRRARPPRRCPPGRS